MLFNLGNRFNGLVYLIPIFLYYLSNDVYLVHFSRHKKENTVFSKISEYFCYIFTNVSSILALLRTSPRLETFLS